MAGREQRTKDNKKKWVLKFVAIVVSIVVIFLLIAIPLASKFYDNETGEFSFNIQKNEQPNKSITDEESNTENNVSNKQETEKLKLNIAIFGLDKAEALTDVIIVAMYNSETNRTNLVWVPRDTKVTIPDDRRQVLLSEGRHAPNVVKINAVHGYAGKKYGNEYAKLQVQELLDIEIDNYVVVNLEAFRFIVDTLEGVEFNVPQNMYYADPAQDLLINLKAGYQLLDGKKAEQFVRMRSIYPDADLGRIKAQQEFMKKLFGQALSRESVMKNLLDYIYAFFRYVETDLNIADVSKYMKFIGNLNVNDMETYTIPGVGGSYYVHDAKATKELIDSILNEAPAAKTEAVASASSTNSVIKVLNGGMVDGLAQKKANMLKENGFVNVSTGNYNGIRKPETRIFVGEQGKGQDIKEIFAGSEIIVDKSQLEGNVDIVVVLGTNES